MRVKIKYIDHFAFDFGLYFANVLTTTDVMQLRYIGHYEETHTTG